MFCVLVEFGDPVVTTQVRVFWWVCFQRVQCFTFHYKAFSFEELFFTKNVCIHLPSLSFSPPVPSFHQFFLHLHLVTPASFFLLLLYNFQLLLLLFSFCCSLLLFSFWLPSAGKRERNQVRSLFFVIFILSFDFLFFRKNKALASDFPHISACAHEVRSYVMVFLEDCCLRLSDTIRTVANSLFQVQLWCFFFLFITCNAYFIGILFLFQF